jgi:hypothetical protein
MINPSEIVSRLLVQLEYENPLNISQNFMGRVLIYLTDRPEYEKRRSKWGSTISQRWWDRA